MSRSCCKDWKPIKTTTHRRNPRELQRGVPKLAHRHKGIMKRLLEPRRVEMIVTKAKRVFANDIPRERAERVVDLQHLPSLVKFGDMFTQSINFGADGGLER